MKCIYKVKEECTCPIIFHSTTKLKMKCSERFIRYINLLTIPIDDMHNIDKAFLKTMENNCTYSNKLKILKKYR